MNNHSEPSLTSSVAEFCDWHVFHYRYHSRVVIVHQPPAWVKPTPVVTWLEVRVDEDSSEHEGAAVLFAETLAQSARTDGEAVSAWTTSQPRDSNAPGRLYRHYTDGTITDWPVEWV
jgi:hypothetical protein